MRSADLEAAASAIRAVLDAVVRGEIEADTPTERRMLRQLEGALGALEAIRQAQKKPAD